MKPGQTVHAVSNEYFDIHEGQYMWDNPDNYIVVSGSNQRITTAYKYVFETREAAENKLTDLINTRIQQLETEITELKNKLPCINP